jgi:hypothetical protein
MLTGQPNACEKYVCKLTPAQPAFGVGANLTVGLALLY